VINLRGALLVAIYTTSSEFVCIEHILMDIQSSIPALSFVGTNLLQDGVDKHCVSSNQGAYMLADISMRDDSFHSWKHDHIQHGFPNRDGGPKVIRFESLRWRPKSSSSSSRSP